MTNFINYTKDRFIDRDLNELVRIEEMLKPYPEEVDLENISLAHVMLKEKQEKLAGSVERGAFAAGLKNPLKEKLYQDTLPTHKKQPLSTKGALNSPHGNDSNGGMTPTNQQSATIDPSIIDILSQNVQKLIPDIRAKRQSRYDSSKSVVATNLNDAVRYYDKAFDPSLSQEEKAHTTSHEGWHSDQKLKERMRRDMAIKDPAKRHDAIQYIEKVTDQKAKDLIRKLYDPKYRVSPLGY